MADCLDIIKEKIRMEFSSCMEGDGGPEELGTLTQNIINILVNWLPLTDDDVVLIQHAVENVIIMADTDTGWCSIDEWVEASGRLLLKQPQIVVKRWKTWYNLLFDLLDQDKDGYINADQFNIVYELTSRKNNKEFKAHAFAVIDTENAGKLSRDQFVNAFVTYLTDPDVAYAALPLY